MRAFGKLRRVARGVVVASVFGGFLLAACASLDGLTGAPTSPDDASTPDAAVDVQSRDAAVADAACVPRYLPPEGTYAYGHVFSADVLSVNGGSVATQPFDLPFFATVRHETEGIGCWTFTAYLANGAMGRHDHQWKFCNRCDKGGSFLDLIEERDYFRTVVLGNVTVQTSLYTCGSPNAYIDTETALDASVALSGCTGQTTGAQSSTLMINPLDYRYQGRIDKKYQSYDASAPCEVYVGSRQVQAAGGGAPQVSPNSWSFEAATGLPMTSQVLAKVQTKLGVLDVNYTFSLFFNRTAPTMTPLLPRDDAGL